MGFASGIAKRYGDIGSGLSEGEGREASETQGSTGDETSLAAQRFIGIFVHERNSTLTYASWNSGGDLRQKRFGKSHWRPGKIQVCPKWDWPTFR
jgi:hypothetical protein